MVSPLRLPYEYRKIDELNYEFVNRDGVNYHLYFTPISSIYPDLLNTYSFSIEREGTNPHPIDLRIAATVVYILRRFFDTIENAMIMVCDSTDGKQQGSNMVVNGATTIRTSLQSGSIAVVKIGERSIKVLLK